MSMTIRMRVKQGDKEQVIVCGQSDFIYLEREYDIATSALSSAMRMEWIAWMAWKRLVRSKQTTLSFEEWLDTDPEVEMLEDEAASGNVPAPQE